MPLALLLRADRQHSHGVLRVSMTHRVRALWLLGERAAEVTDADDELLRPSPDRVQVLRLDRAQEHIAGTERTGMVRLGEDLRRLGVLQLADGVDQRLADLPEPPDLVLVTVEDAELELGDVLTAKWRRDLREVGERQYCDCRGDVVGDGEG